MKTNAARVRVLHVLGSLEVGGCETLCLQLLRAHDRSIFAPELVVLSSAKGVLAPQFHGVPGLRIHECLHRPGEKLSFLSRFRRLCRELRPSVVLSYAFGLHAMVAAAARTAGVPRIFVTVQNPPPLDALARRRTRWLAQLARPFCAGEVAATEHVAAQLVKMYGLPRRRVRVIHNGCDVRQIEERAAKGRAARPSRWPDSGPHIGMVARLDPIKDQATLIQAVAGLRGRYPGIGLSLIGDGPMRPALQEMAMGLGLGDTVHFLGSRPDVPEQLGTLDLFALSTTANEGFGIALIEAMAAGLPIAASDVGACREVLDSGRLGLLAPPGDAAALAAAMDNLLKDHVMRRRMALNASASVYERYDISRTARAYEALFLQEDAGPRTQVSTEAFASKARE